MGFVLEFPARISWSFLLNKSLLFEMIRGRKDSQTFGLEGKGKPQKSRHFCMFVDEEVYKKNHAV
jgi:hypothetical protein